MDAKKMWDYRVVRQESEDGSDEWYSVQEVYYDDETGEPAAQTVDLMVEGDTVTEIRTQLEQMLQSLEEPVVDEINVPEGLPTKTVEERMLKLEIENAEMSDRITNLGETMVKLGVDGRGNEIYTSSDSDDNEIVVKKEGL